MNIPDGILCSKTHEWALEEENIVSIGLTDWIINQLGDIVFVELPEVGTKFEQNETFATVESIKMAREVYMPVSGEVIEINEILINSPELINEDTYASWFIKIKPDNFQDEANILLEYDDYIEEVN